MILFVGLALGRCNLRDGCSSRQDATEILDIHFVKRRQVRQIVQISIRGCNFVEVHVSFFKVVEQIPHGLPQLMSSGGGIDAAVGAGNKTALGGTIQSLPGKDAWTRSRTGRHVLRANGSPLLQVAHRHAGVLDVSSARKTRHFYGGSCRSVAEFESLRIALVHDPHRDVRRQVRIDEHHVAEVETGGFQDALHAVEREVHLGRGVIRNLTARGIAAGHGGKEQPVVGEDAGRSGLV